MKLNRSLLIAATAILASSAYAGGPDAMSMPVASQNHNLFATLEGGYTWNSLGDTTVTVGSTTHTAEQTNNGGTGRVAVGAIHYSTAYTGLSYTGEMGWGYYGKTSYQSVGGGIDAQNYIYGLDLLAGVDYQIVSAFDVFFKVGGMLQNVRLDRNTNLGNYTNGSVTGSDNSTTTVSSIVPEIKLGGVYNITNEWGLSASYLGAYGNGNVSMNVQKSAGYSYTNATGAPIMLNTLLLGLTYKFA